MTFYWQMLAGYNGWVNERLYATAAQLPDEDYRADKGAFFKSVQGTLNHLLVGDLVWMRRFTGEGRVPEALDAILHDSLPALRDARRDLDTRISRFIAGLDEAALMQTIRYRPMTALGEVEQDLASALGHFFNHQTHHRGQVHALLTGFGLSVPAFDLLVFQRESGIASILS